MKKRSTWIHRLAVAVLAAGAYGMGHAGEATNPPSATKKPNVVTKPRQAQNSFGPVYIRNDYTPDPSLTVKEVQLEYFFSDDKGHLHQKTLKKSNLTVGVGEMVAFATEKDTCVYEARVKLIATTNATPGGFYLVDSYPLHLLNGCITEMNWLTSNMIAVSD